MRHIKLTYILAWVWKINGIFSQKCQDHLKMCLTQKVLYIFIWLENHYFRFSKPLFVCLSSCFLIRNCLPLTLWSFNSHDELIEGYLSYIISTGPIKIICWTMGCMDLHVLSFFSIIVSSRVRTPLFWGPPPPLHPLPSFWSKFKMLPPSFWEPSKLVHVNCLGTAFNFFHIWYARGMNIKHF